MDNGIIHTYFCFWHRVRVVNETAAIDVWRLRWYNFYSYVHTSQQEARSSHHFWRPLNQMTTN